MNDLIDQARELIEEPETTQEEVAALEQLIERLEGRLCVDEKTK